MAAADSAEELESNDSLKFCAGSLLWYYSNKETGWWPCLITEVSEEDGESGVCLQALGDKFDYGFVRMTSSELRPFTTYAECKDMVQEQLKRLGKKRSKTLLKTFVAAVKEAHEHTPSFQLDLELPYESHSPSTPQSPPHARLFLDSSIFTPGSCSQPDRVTRSSQRWSLRSVALPRSPMECHSMPPGTTESVKSDILVGNSRRRKRRSSPVRKKLCLDHVADDDTTCKTDILLACESMTCSVPPKRKKNQSENESAVAPYGARGEVDGEGEKAGGKLSAMEYKEEGEKGTDEVDRRLPKEASLVGGEVAVGRSSLFPTRSSRMMPLEENGELTTRGREGEGEVERGVTEREAGNREKGERGEEEEEVERKGGGEGGEERSTDGSSSDEDLPSYLTNRSTEVVVNDLKEGDHIWSKCQTYPHWPALVVKVRPARRKADAVATIVFFGDNEDFTMSIRHKMRRNLARFVFGTQQFEDFMKAGRESEHADYFLRSVKEAESFIDAKCKKELTGSALEMFKQICQRRPPSQAPCISWMDHSLSVQEDEEPPAYSAFGFRLDPEFMDTEDRSDAESEPESEEEEENPLYSLDKVLEHFTQLKPILEGIMCGSVPSEYHRLFTGGTSREKHQLGICRKYGPCQKWKTGKKLALIHHLEKIAKEVSGAGTEFLYSEDVLLPEAMTRTISHFEQISELEAREKL